MPLNHVSGIIRKDEIYTRDELKAKLGFKDAALRTMRKNGLPVIREANRVFYSGRALFEYLEGREQVEG